MPLSAGALEPLVYHINANGFHPRAEELRVASLAFPFISIQDSRLREATGRALLSRLWPSHVTYGFFHDEEGPACHLLVHAGLRPEEVRHETRQRHRLTAVRVTLADGAPLVVSSYYAPPSDSAGLLRGDLLAAILAFPRALVLGDLNAWAMELGC